MTCIVAVKFDNKILMGGDSAGVGGWDLTIRSDQKVFFKGGVKQKMLIGFTSSFRMGQLIQYNLELPECTDHEYKDPMRYLIKKFIPELRNCLKQNGHTTVSNNCEEGGEFLVAFSHQIFHIYSDFQVSQSKDDFDSCGSGANYAKGSLYHQIDNDLTSQKLMVLNALDCAVHFSAGVRGPMIIKGLKEDGSALPESGI